MKTLWTIALAGAAVLAAQVSQAAHGIPAYITAAVNDSGRPADDTKRDADRKPGEVIAFAGIKPGMHIAELVPGSGYFTRIFAKVVGDKGYVYAYVPSELDEFVKKKLGNVDVSGQFHDYSNVSVLHQPLAKFVLPEQVDVVWTSQNYHDFHDPFFGPQDMAALDKAIFAALKPGGVFLVIDHSAPKGSGIADTNTLHRIDEAVVKQEVEAAGFKLAGESNVLRNPKDDRTLKVFDPSIRGKTDQFVLKFVKPRH